jgi:hypothetical protein
MRILKVCREALGLVTEWLGKGRTPRRRVRTTRPQLEVLERREVPATLTVTSAADDGGAGTLRTILMNAAAGDTIAFDIGARGKVATITPTTPYRRSTRRS